MMIYGLFLGIPGTDFFYDVILTLASLQLAPLPSPVGAGSGIYAFVKKPFIAGGRSQDAVPAERSQVSL
jgi:hypothetical protein